MRWAEFIDHPLRYIFVSMSDRHWLDKMSDKHYLRIYYRLSLGKRLDLNNPKTFNEKMQWIKLYDRKPLYTTMVDKFSVKKYVSDLIGEEHVIRNLGVWDRFEQIDFSKLPNQFVLKCTHDSGGLIICRDKSKLDIGKAKQKIEASLNNRFFYSGREWPYKDVPPRILAEEYMQNGDEENLVVYKIFNFSGKPYMLQVIQNDKTSSETIDYFDTDWNRLNLRQNFPNSPIPVKKPAQLQEMIGYAEILSTGFPFLRTDFYVINGEVYFSEFTFFSDCGFKAFDPPEWDLILGEKIKLPI